jgi:hypothetical protein
MKIMHSICVMRPSSGVRLYCFIILKDVGERDGGSTLSCLQRKICLTQ